MFTLTLETPAHQLPVQGEKIMANRACQSVGTDVFSTDNINRCKKYVSSIQRRLDKAVAGNNKSKIRWYTHILSKKSRAVKILAVHRVTSLNQGKYTAGTDGVRMIRGRKGVNEQIRLSLLDAINVKKEPSPIRRIYIPKPNGKKRPLGIPTLADRVIQDILRTALEPITEYHASDNSYGFRPKRSCHDAIQHLFAKLCRRGSKQWILEGDIAGCFDNIAHAHILNTLKSWKVSESIVNIIGRMLRAKVFSDDRLLDVNTGTPQGGILSPMLANVALTALDDFCYENFGTLTKRGGKQRGKYIQNPIIRYADDFVIICASEQEAELVKEKVATFLKDNISLELSDEKTKITHISEGFGFLGFNIRAGMRVHADDKDTKEYWNKRVYTNALSQVYSIKVKRLIERQKGICPCCGNPITKDDIADKKAHAHHMLPRSEGGTEKLNNLRLLHQDCHGKAHQVMPRKEMAYWIRKKPNYITKGNIVHFQKHPDAKVA